MPDIGPMLDFVGKQAAGRKRILMIVQTTDNICNRTNRLLPESRDDRVRACAIVNSLNHQIERMIREYGLESEFVFYDGLYHWRLPIPSLSVEPRTD